MIILKLTVLNYLQLNINQYKITHNKLNIKRPIIMKKYNSQPNISISRIILLMGTLIPLMFLPTMIKFASVILDLEKVAPQLASTMSTMKTISSCIIAFIIIIAIGSEIINTNDDDNNKSKDDSVIVEGKFQPVKMSNSSAIENNNKSNSSIPMNPEPKTIYCPNVDRILSMIGYVEDLQKQIKNSLNANNKKPNNSPITNYLPLKLNGIDQSIFVKFNILKDNFMLDYKAIDWNNNINQEISNFYQKIYDKHQNLLQVEYDNIKNYLTDYLDHQAIKSEEILDLIKKIIN